MKKKYFIIIILVLTILIPIGVRAEYTPSVTLEYVQNKQNIPDDIPEYGSKAIYIANPVTGKVIYEKNAHEKMYPASTTKILTALVVMENCKMSDTAIVSQNAIDMVPEGYSNAKLQAGEEHTIEDLLYALLLPSANEAANVLAEHVSGSVEEYAELCNKRAAELGCESLHFVNANGMHDENHYCSAYDLYIIAKECQKYDVFNKITKAKTYSLPSTDIYPDTRVIRNTNELLFPGTYYYEYCNGIKTGHTTPAGECLVASSSYNNLDLISVVLGGESVNSHGQNDRFYDTKKLFEYTYDNYSVKTIAEYGTAVATLDVGKATKETEMLDVIVDTDIATVVPNDISKENITSTISLDKNIVAPIDENQVLGQITYHADGLEYTTNVIASHSVEKLPYGRYNVIVIISLVSIFVLIIVLIKVFKRRRGIVAIIIIVVLIGVGAYIYPNLKRDIKHSETIITIAPNTSLND